MNLASTSWNEAKLAISFMEIIFLAWPYLTCSYKQLKQPLWKRNKEMKVYLVYGYLVMYWIERPL